MINRLVILAAVLMAVCMGYSLNNVLDAADEAGGVEAQRGHERPEEQSPYAARLVRPDGATVIIRADSARIWDGKKQGQTLPAWLELEGDVIIETPEGRIHAPRLAYDPHTGRYHAETLGLVPAGGN